MNILSLWKLNTWRYFSFICTFMTWFNFCPGQRYNLCEKLSLFLLQEKPYDKDDDVIKATSFEVISTLRDVLKTSSLWRDQVQTYTQVWGYPVAFWYATYFSFGHFPPFSIEWEKEVRNLDLVEMHLVSGKLAVYFVHNLQLSNFLYLQHVGDFNYPRLADFGAAISGANKLQSQEVLEELDVS